MNVKLMLLIFVCALVTVSSCSESPGPSNTKKDTTVSPSPNVELVSIEPGSYRAGNWKFGYLECSVTLTKGFWIGRYEVTQALWKSIVGSIPSGELMADSLPVARVGFYDAIEFCNGLSAKEGLQAVYTIVNDTLVTWDRNAKGYRLPTQAEWEYACRAGTTTDTYNGDIVNWNSADPVLDEIAWYRHSSKSEKHQVGLKKPNSWGLYDMVGNVAEICWDKGMHTYDTTTKVDPVSEQWSLHEGARTRRLAGSGFNNEPRQCFSGFVMGICYNDKIFPFKPEVTHGLRLVRSK